MSDRRAEGRDVRGDGGGRGARADRARRRRPRRQAVRVHGRRPPPVVRSATTSPFGGRVGHAALLVPELLRLLNTATTRTPRWACTRRRRSGSTRPSGSASASILTGAVQRQVREARQGLHRHRRRGALAARTGACWCATGRSRSRASTPTSTSAAARASGRRPRRYVQGDWPEGRPPETASRAATAIGTPFQGRPKQLHQDQMSVFSNVQAFWRNIHTDVEVARKAGSDRTIAQGLMLSVYLSEFGTELFGRSWYESGWTLHTFLHPVYAGDTVTARAVVWRRPSRQPAASSSRSGWRTRTA